MKSISRIMLLLGVLSLFVLACGISDSASDKVNEAVQSAATQVVEQVNTAVPDAGTAIAEVEQAATKVAEQPAATDTPEATNSDGATDGTEEAAIDITSLTSSLDQFDSYKSTTEMNYEGDDVDGNPTSGSMLLLSEEIKAPYASHVLVSFEGDIANEMGETASDGAASMEMYNVDGVFYMQNPEDNTWMSFPSDGDSAGFGDFFSADDFVNLPDNAHKSLLPQTVNGISTWHYTFTEKDLPVADREGVETAEGEIWIARDGDFPVKLMFTVTGADLMGDGTVNNGTLHMKYELTDINSVKSIVVPDDVKNAAEDLGSALGGGDTSGNTGSDSTDGGATSGLANIDFPMLDDADVQFSMEGMSSYLTNASGDEIVAFYNSKLIADGWTTDESMNFQDETGGWLSFTKDNISLDVIFDATDPEARTITLMATDMSQ